MNTIFWKVGNLARRSFQDFRRRHPEELREFWRRSLDLSFLLDLLLSHFLASIGGFLIRKVQTYALEAPIFELFGYVCFVVQNAQMPVKSA